MLNSVLLHTEIYKPLCPASTIYRKRSRTVFILLLLYCLPTVYCPNNLLHCDY